MADLLELLIDHKEGIPLVMYKQFLAPHPIYTASVVVTVVAEVRWDWHPKMSYCNHQTGRVCHLLKENQGMVDPVLGCFWCKILSKTFFGIQAVQSLVLRLFGVFPKQHATRWDRSDPTTPGHLVHGWLHACNSWPQTAAPDSGVSAGSPYLKPILQKWYINQGWQPKSPEDAESLPLLFVSRHLEGSHDPDAWRATQSLGLLAYLRFGSVGQGWA